MILNRETIARAGLALLDEKGSDGLTMRALAASLGVQAPALYWHVKNRRELIDLMGEVIVQEAYESFDLSTAPWDVSWPTELAHFGRQCCDTTRAPGYSPAPLRPMPPTWWSRCWTP